MVTAKEVSWSSLQLLQVTPDVLCECFLQTSFLHTSQHCFNNHLTFFIVMFFIVATGFCNGGRHGLQSLTLIGLSGIKSSLLSTSLTLSFPTSLSLSVSANISPKALAPV